MGNSGVPIKTKRTRQSQSLMCELSYRGEAYYYSHLSDKCERCERKYEVLRIALLSRGFFRNPGTNRIEVIQAVFKEGFQKHGFTYWTFDK